MSKKLHISLIFSNLVVFKTLSPNHRMYNLYTKFVKILEIFRELLAYLEYFDEFCIKVVHTMVWT